MMFVDKSDDSTKIKTLVFEINYFLLTYSSKSERKIKVQQTKKNKSIAFT